MVDNKNIKIGDKIKISQHHNKKYIGKTGVLLSAQTPRPAIDGQVLKWKVCKVKLEDTGEIVDCLLSQLYIVK
ncbi:MAG: hypothetical protein ACTSW1_00355 [Candidatus Hodarchaeales archaeon]